MEIPKGWKLVPIKPTADMIFAAELAQWNWCEDRAAGRPLPCVHIEKALWAGMLATAPSPE